MQEFDEYTIPTIKKASFDFSRFEKPKTKAGSERASLIEPFVTKLNNARKAGGYKPLGAAFYAAKMAYIPTDELFAFYKKLDSSDNFSALWWYHCSPKPVMKIYCTGCQVVVEPRLTDGKEIYPHREDLYNLPFWKCDTCSNYVGCHHKTANPTKPLGVIATKEIMTARKHIHALLDPLWTSNKVTRRKAYKHISDKIGKEYHTGNISSIEEARSVYKIVAELHNSLIKN